jgi:hypothetical protein
MSADDGTMSLMLRRLVLRSSVLLVAIAAVPAVASQTSQYTYDARGRLVQVLITGPVGPGYKTTYQYDGADNRSNVTVFASWTAKSWYAGDFNGDGRSDSLFRDNLGNITDWLGTSAGGFSNNNANAAVYISPDWVIVGVGDFNGDGRSDILFRNYASGWLTEWLGTASGGFINNGSNATVAITSDWKIVGIADFNGDGKSDILWRRDDGWLTDWLGTSSGGFTANGANLSTLVAPDWKVTGTGDFNGDGFADVLWRRDSDGWFTEWLGSAGGGFSPNSAVSYSVPAAWKIVGVGKFNSDARSDILWRNDNGDVEEWLSTTTGDFSVNSAAYYSVGIDWRVAGIGNFDGAGSSDDILWRSNISGDLTDWLGTSTGTFNNNDINAYSGLATNWSVEPK